MKIIECPRDAMQGLHEFIPTETKAVYINQLLKVGFDTIDFGSFVSPKAIPQLKDTAEVLDKLDLTTTRSKLLAIVANERGASDASVFPQISCLGFPLSISETFQQRNTNKSIAEALVEIEKIQEICSNSGKSLVTYISMGFGNPYGDPFTFDYIEEFVIKLQKINVGIISLADTIGVSNPENIKYIFAQIIPKFPEIEFGAHLHSTSDTAKEKISAVIDSGCKRIDGAIKGFGGCPMAKDELVGNIATEKILEVLDEKKIKTGINQAEFDKAYFETTLVF
jgi:hydroxymethylglutaryl-CoA lyase